MRRMPLIAQVLVCTGSACGARGLGSFAPSLAPPPVARLQARWVAGRWYPRIHLGLAGCLGRCDRPSQALIVHGAATWSFGGIDDPRWWDALIAWTEATVARGALAPSAPLDRFRTALWT